MVLVQKNSAAVIKYRLCHLQRASNASMRVKYSPRYEFNNLKCGCQRFGDGPSDNMHYIFGKC